MNNLFATEPGDVNNASGKTGISNPGNPMSTFSESARAPGAKAYDAFTTVAGASHNEAKQFDPLGSKAKKAAKDKANAEKDAADKAAADTKATADAAAVQNISGKNLAAATEVTAQNAADIKKLEDLGKQSGDALATLTTSTKENSDAVKAQISNIAQLTKDTDPKALAATLATQQAEITKQKMDLAEQAMKWSEGIATSYQDIGQRYKDAVTGLTDSEKRQRQSQTMQDFAAMSAMGSAGANAAMNRGGAISGVMASTLQGASQRAATDSYAASQARTADLDAQRRQMQFAIVQSASNDERANRGLGFGMESQVRGEQAGYLQTGFQSEAGLKTAGNENAYAHGMTTYSNTLSGINQMQSYGQDLFGSNMANNQFQQGIVGQAGGMAQNSIAANLGANTYLDEAGIALREGVYSQNMSLGSAAQARKDAADAADRQRRGQVGGAVGAVAGAYFSKSPQGAAAGYQAGEAAGQSA